MPLPLTFDFYNSIIEVPSPDTSLSLQYLIDQIRDAEDNLTPGLVFQKIADASGKEDLGGGVSTAITVRLLDNWRLRFEARGGPSTVQCTISGGNLVGGPGGNPIAASTYTQILNLSSASGTIAVPTTANEATNLKYLIAALDKSTKSVGNIYYWDPISGNDANTGLTPTSAVSTFAQAHTLAVSGNNDVIFALASDSSGLTTTTEVLVISKANIKLRGPGHIFQLIPTSAAVDTVTVSAPNVEISGFNIQTHTSGTRNAISVTDDKCVVKDCWISYSRGDGINISTSSNSKISNCVIEGALGDGLNIGTSTVRVLVEKCIIFNTVNGIIMAGSGLSDNILEDSLIYKNSGYGVSIGSGVANTIVRGGNTIVNNTAGNTSDNGTDTYIETPAGGASATEIADAVWDEVLSGHITIDSAGKTLKDTKTKATIASLK